MLEMEGYRYALFLLMHEVTISGFVVLRWKQNRLGRHGGALWKEEEDALGWPNALRPNETPHHCSSGRGDGSVKDDAGLSAS